MVIIFCGVPGTGKSTLAKILAEKLKEKGRVEVLVPDEIGGKRYERIYNWIGENFSQADYLIIDATFYKKKWREKVKQISNGKNVFTCYLYCSLKTCLERNRLRKPSFPERVIYIINSKMEKPENPNLSIDTDKIEPKEGVTRILNKIKKR